MKQPHAEAFELRAVGLAAGAAKVVESHDLVADEFSDGGSAYGASAAGCNQPSSLTGVDWLAADKGFTHENPQ